MTKEKEMHPVAKRIYEEAEKESHIAPCYTSPDVSLRQLRNICESIPAEKAEMTAGEIDKIFDNYSTEAINALETNMSVPSFVQAIKVVAAIIDKLKDEVKSLLSTSQTEDKK